MPQFLQLHLLTAFPPANLNRDDTGRPKTAIVGGSERLRISSQALKRAWRTSDVFQGVVGDAIGIRSQRFLLRLVDKLEEGGLDHEEATRRARLSLAVKAPQAAEDGQPEDGKKLKVTGKSKASLSGKIVFGSLQTKEGRENLTNELVHLGPEEIAVLDDLADSLARGKAPDAETLDLLEQRPRAADIAMFGRMLADNPKYNVEAAVQVAHAITTHRVTVEDDYFTAAEQLKGDADDRGAGYVDVQEFGAGLFYTYVCVDTRQLLENLKGDKGLVTRAIEGLIRAAATVSPRGKQNSFASRAYTHYLLAERGPAQPRSLAAAFLKSVSANGVGPSITALESLRDGFDRAYGACAEERAVMNVESGTGTLSDILALATIAIEIEAAATKGAADA
jgi:CRISPR system Cascade subunit CasC